MTDKTDSPLQEQSPPSYDSIADPPPTYESVFGEIRQARQESSGVLDFLKKVILVFLSTIGCTICLAVFLALPIASIVIGVKYLDDCTIEDKIPVYLIVAGAFGVFRNLLGLYNQFKRKNSENDEENDNKKTTFEGCIDCFLIAWFICGNVWVYSNYKPVYDNPASPDYCDKTLYLFAFGVTTASYVIIGLFCVCMCCIAFCSLLLEFYEIGEPGKLSSEEKGEKENGNKKRGKVRSHRKGMLSKQVVSIFRKLGLLIQELKNDI